MPTLGNNPDKWQQLLDLLDERLQLGLLDRLRRAEGYHFEGKTLTVILNSEEDRTYLGKFSSLQALKIFAEDATGVDEVEIQAPKSVE